MRVDYFALINRLITELQERFPNKLQHFSPLQYKHMDMIDAESHLSKIATTYDLDESRLIAQWKSFCRCYGRKSEMSIAATYLLVSREHEDLQRAYQILLTLPVSSAGFEQSFSKLAYIKSKLHTTMGQECLESLMFTAIEKDILVSLPKDRLVSKFVTEANRHIDLD